MNIISYGGGVQTAALLVLNAWGYVQPRATHAVFADTGSDLESTYQHINDTMRNYAKSQDIELVTVKTHLGPLHEFVANGKVVIPAYGDKGGMVHRRCTERWKIRPIRAWMRSQGAKESTVQIGISTDEAHRMKDSDVKWARNIFPLVDLGHSRQDCINLLKSEGLPIPPKSACWMCPYRRISEWNSMQLDTPLEFKKAVEFESTMEGLYLTAALQPLDIAVGKQHRLFQDDECGGYCWT